MINLIGKTLGPYQVVLNIRATPTTRLYKAYHQKLGRNVALLVVQPEPSSANFADQPIRYPAALPERMKSHARLLAQLSHPNIASILDCEMYDGLLCLAFDFVPRAVFRRRFHQTMPWQQACQALIPTAQALNYAHQQGMLHGNLRLDQLVLTEEGSIVLFDFGVDLLVSQEMFSLLPGNWMGINIASTTAPEQILGKKFDHRVDIYGLGTVLFELVTGRRVYSAETPLEEVLCQQTQPLPQMQSEVSELPPAAALILQKTLAPAPKDRFPEMQPLLVLLARYALNQEVTQEMAKDPRKALTPPRRGTSKRRLLWGALAAVLILAAAGLAWLVYGQNLAPSPQVVAGVTAEPTASPTLALPTATSTPRPSPTPKPTSTPEARATPAPQLPLALQYPLLFDTPLSFTPSGIHAISALKVMSLMRWGIGTLNDLAWSPDGQQLALVTTEGVFIIDPTDSSLVGFIDTAGIVNSAAFSPDGSLIATGEENGLVRLWDAAAYRETAALAGHFAQVNSLAFSPDGQYLASGSNDMTVWVWEISSKQPLWTLQGHVKEVTGVAFSPDGETLASAGIDFKLNLWEMGSGELEQTLTHRGALTDVVFSPDGSTIFTGEGSRVTQWNLSTGTAGNDFRGMNAKVTAIDISSDGKYVAAGDYAGQVYVWDRNAPDKPLWSAWNERLARNMRAGFNYTHMIAFKPDASLLGSGIWDNTIQFFKPTEKTPTAVIDRFSDYVNDLRVSPNSQFVAAQLLDGKVKVWDLKKGQVRYIFSGTIPQGVVFSYNNHYLALIDNPGTVKIYDLNSGEEAFSFGGHSNVQSVAFSPGKVYFATGNTSQIRLWSLVSKQEVITDDSFDYDGCVVANTLKDEPVAFSSRMGFIGFVKANNPRLCSIVRPGWAKTLVFNPQYPGVGDDKDYPLLAFGGASKLEMSNYSETTSNEVRDMQGLMGYEVQQIAVTQDGKIVAAALDDFSIRVWNGTNGKELIRLEGHDDDILAMTFTPDLRFLITSSLDGTIRVWGVP